MTPVRVISLDDAHARRASFAKQNQHLDYEIINAVRGTQIAADVLGNRNLFAPDLKYSKGALGCALSHLAAWFEAIDTQQPVTVAEDDAIFRHDFHQQQQQIIANAPADWDILVWAWNFDSILSTNAMPGISHAVMVFDQNQLRQKTLEFQQSTQTPVLLPLDKCFGTPAYTISPKGAARFVEECFPLSNFMLYFPVLNRNMLNNGIDIAMNRVYSQCQSYVAFPPLAITKNEHEISSIQAERNL
ncbi:glycosyltransferase family 25 protein [Herbaspirillum huttiense]|uniref:glycosyltransferase family 25 protein n=1 Tax=Herbaspirillum huttiense TaxID=863372 RepID=UPI0039B0AC5B